MLPDRQAFLTKVRPGSISNAVKDLLIDKGWHTATLHESADIRMIDRLEPFEHSTELMVNTVGITDAKPPGKWTYEATDRLISTNLTAAIALTSAFVRATAGSPGVKTIIHVGSLWSRKHATNGPVYCASKAGLAHYIACMGHELNLAYPGEYTIVGIHPGNVQGTPLTKRVQHNLKTDRGMTKQDIDKLYDGTITAQEVAKQIYSLIGNRWLSGENIYLGGGDKR